MSFSKYLFHFKNFTLTSAKFSLYAVVTPRQRDLLRSFPQIFPVQLLYCRPSKNPCSTLRLRHTILRTQHGKTLGTTRHSMTLIRRLTASTFLQRPADLSFQVTRRRNTNDFNSDPVIKTMTKENGSAPTNIDARSASMPPAVSNIAITSVRPAPHKIIC